MSARKTETIADGIVLRDVEGLFTAFAHTTRWLVMRYTHLWRPPTDVYETDEAFVIQVEIAGMRGADFAVSIQDRLVTVSGVRQDAGEARAYQQMEIHFGEFRTDVELPGPFNRETMEASYNDGYLRLVMPKPKTRKIEIDTPHTTRDA